MYCHCVSYAFLHFIFAQLSETTNIICILQQRKLYLRKFNDLTKITQLVRPGGRTLTWDEPTVAAKGERTKLGGREAPSVVRDRKSPWGRRH